MLSRNGLPTCATKKKFINYTNIKVIKVGSGIRIRPAQRVADATRSCSGSTTLLMISLNLFHSITSLLICVYEGSDEDEDDDGDGDNEKDDQPIEEDDEQNDEGDEQNDEDDEQNDADEEQNDEDEEQNDEDEGWNPLDQE